jgi:hypothetical protein
LLDFSVQELEGDLGAVLALKLSHDDGDEVLHALLAQTGDFADASVGIALRNKLGDFVLAVSKSISSSVRALSFSDHHSGRELVLNASERIKKVVSTSVTRDHDINDRLIKSSRELVADDKHNELAECLSTLKELSVLSSESRRFEKHDLSLGGFRATDEGPGG